MEIEDYLVNEAKVYISVNVYHRSDGRILPRSFIWEDGRCFTVDQIIDIRPAASLKAGGAGLRYTVRVCNRETFMFLEENKEGERWFMERKMR